MKHNPADKEFWDRVETTFFRLTEEPFPVQVETLHREYRDDPELIAEVLDLLRAHQRSHGFLETQSGDSDSLISHLIKRWDSMTTTGNGLPDRNSSTGRNSSGLPSARSALPELSDLQNALDSVHPHYELIAIVGSGGSGVVAKARDSRLGRLTAIKFLRSESSAVEAALESTREARAVAMLNNDHVVNVYEVSPPEAPMPFLVMQWIDGPPLNLHLSALGSLPPRDAAEIARQIAVGLSAAHDLDIIHGDIKPANVMLESNRDMMGATKWRAKLTDFGLASMATTAAGGEPRTIAHFRGTPAYSSPEQLLQSFPSDVLCDIWSLGATLYEMITGTTPYRGAPHVVVQQMQSSDPTPPRRFDRRIPRDLESICMMALARYRDRRYMSAREITEDLGRFLDGRPVRARRINSSTRLRWSTNPE